MKKFMKLSVLLPIGIGVMVGALLFILGEADDAPGLCLMGLVAAFLLIMRGLWCAGVIKKGVCVPIILFCFGMGGGLLSIILLLDGELEQSLWMAPVGVLLGAVLIACGTIRLRKIKTS